jgi:hypothetical protein
MKYLFIFLLVSTTVYSQNYHYAVDEAKEKATPDTTAPTSPINLIVSNITQTTATLNWKASTDNVGVVIYRVYNDGTLLNSTENPATSYTLTGLSPATDYNITIRAVDAAANESGDSNMETVTTEAYVATNNMIDEIAYFDAVLVPLTAKDSLQYYLDTYGSIRLENADYGRVSGKPINIGSNQSIYGHPYITEFPNIHILAGSTNVHLENLYNYQIFFDAGAPITNCVLNTIKFATVRSTGGMIENCLFLNLNSAMNFDMSASGYYRNNRIYRQQVHGPVALILKGNSATPSYGNINVWSNYLTPFGNGVIMDNIADMTFIGIDSEGWNMQSGSTVAMFDAKHMGDLKITDFGGGGYYGGLKIPEWDIEADDILFLNKAASNIGSVENSTARGNTNVFSIRPAVNAETYNVENGFDFQAHPTTGASNPPLDISSIYYDGILENSTITDPVKLANLTNVILKPQHAPIARPINEPLPDPLGATWDTDRKGKPDSTAYLQNLIDTQSIAEVPEGIYYIGSTLYINSEPTAKQGITGKGTGKTIICGLTDDFPLITVTNSNNSQANINLNNLTLQGGSIGVYFPAEIRLAAFNVWKNVIFRNQNIGLYFYWLFGFDNNWIENFNFVNCGTGIKNVPKPKDGSQDWEDNWLGYIDKTVFYKCQFINCDSGVSITAERANNLNHFIDCNFDGNGMAIDFRGNNFSALVNCDFTNNTGDAYGEIIKSDSHSMYNCNFYGNRGNYIMNTQTSYIEGCTFSDNITLLSGRSHRQTSTYILNSTSNGALGGGFIGGAISNENKGVFINSTFTQDATLSKLMVNMRNDIRIPILNTPSTTYPQFLVKH